MKSNSPMRLQLPTATEIPVNSVGLDGGYYPSIACFWNGAERTVVESMIRPHQELTGPLVCMGLEE